MKKEKWLLREIERWRDEAIISAETAVVLRARYAPKKNQSLMTMLFAIIGALFIGMGIILIVAYNGWYRLPIAMRTIIAFLPLILSQLLALYVYRKKMHSTAFRESAAILNTAGVFASIAIVGQIFHLPSDFTNYILICGVLSFPTMVVMNAVAPLLVYYWTVLNGGLCLAGEWGIPVTLLLYAAGAAYAVYNFRHENGRAAYMSWITVISGFILLMVSTVMSEYEPILLLLAYFAMLQAMGQRWELSGKALRCAGSVGVMVLIALMTFEFMWQYSIEMESITLNILMILCAVAAISSGVVSIIREELNIFLYISVAVWLIRIIWACFGLENSAISAVFMVMMNVVMLASGVYYICIGAKNVNLLWANAGMVIVCTFIIMRFFDSEMSLAARGVVFMLIGIGFLLFNMHLIRIRKGGGGV